MTTGLTEAQICNMVSLCMEILECEVEVLKPVIEYLKKQGVTGIFAPFWLTCTVGSFALFEPQFVSFIKLKEILCAMLLESVCINFVHLCTHTDIPALLLMNPKLLSYSRSANGKVLERGSMRAAVVSTPPGDLASVRIAIYREGTTFGTSPISPWKPKGL